MDDFFNILIGFIIIYSILSPFFKKKKPTAPVNKVQQKTRFENARNLQIKPVSSFNENKADILQQLENILKGDLVIQDNSVYDEQHNYNEAEEYDKFGEHTGTFSEHVKEIPVLNEKSKSVFSNLETSFNVEKSVDKMNPLVRNIKTKIREKNSLKESFLISEILGRPKSLQRK